MKDNGALDLDPRRTALLLLHWQNELVKPEGAISDPLCGILAAAGTVHHMQAALRASRSRGVFVVYVNVGHRPGYPEIGPDPAPLAAGLIKAQAFIRGTWGAEVIEELESLPDEIEIVNYSTSAFIYTELDLLLRNRGITTVVLTGLATNWVVESTARDANNRGYAVWTLSDCCNSSSQEAHAYCLTQTLPMLGVVCDSTAYTEALNETERRTAGSTI
jgi:nicotinamidase-related amidase